MKNVNPELVLTTKKLKAAAVRLSDILKEQNVNAGWNHTQRLNVLSECLFGRPYTEAKSTLLDNNSEMSDDVESIYLISVGSKIILVFNDEYKSSTTTCDNSEFSYFDTNTKRYEMPEVLAILPVKNDSEYVDMLQKMGFFRTEGSLFYDFHIAQLVTVNGLSIHHASFMNIDNFENGFDMDALAWDPVSVMDSNMNVFEYAFTFGDLCRAKRVKGGWSVHSTYQNEDVIVNTFSLLNN